MKSCFFCRKIVALAVLAAAWGVSTICAGAVQIRLMFVFDKGAQSYLSQNSLDAYSLASGCVSQMNKVLVNSRLSGRDNLTNTDNDYFSYTLAGVTYVQANNGNTATAWSQANSVVLGNTDPADVAMEGMLEDRAYYAADIIVMFIYRSGGADGNSTPFTGTDSDYAVNFAGKAVSVVDVAMAAEEASGAFGAFQICSHEVAHTLGCGHADTQDIQSGQQSSAYSFGYQFDYPGDQNYTLYQNSSYNAWWGCTVMAYKEHFFINADRTFMSAEDVLALTGWTDADDREHLWNNLDGSYGSTYAKGIWNYCNMLPYFSSPDLCFVNISGETATVVPTSWATAHYDAGTYVPMGDATHNNRQVLIDNCGYASRWHLGVKFAKSGEAAVVNGLADTITLSALSDGCTIYYTMDGTEPTKANGTLYTAPISLSEAATIKARSYDANGNAGDVFTRSYTMNSLGAALGNTALAWTSGTHPWSDTSDGARSGNVWADGGTSVLSTTVTGEGTISFEYQLLVGFDDTLSVLVDGETKATFSEYKNSWTSATVAIEGDAAHTIEWVVTTPSWFGDSTYAKLRAVTTDLTHEDSGGAEEPGDTTAPVPVAVWTSGGFENATNGYSIALGANAVNGAGNIVIADDAQTGAVVEVPGNVQKLSVLVKYVIPAGGAPVAQAVPLSVFNTYDYGALAGDGATDLAGYWFNNSSVQTGSFAFSTPAPAMPQEGYLLLSTWATNTNPDDHGTAFYAGSFIATLAGGEKTGLRFTGANNRVSKIGIGGPTAAGAKPWGGMIVESVAVFDGFLSPGDLANYAFPESDFAGAVPGTVSQCGWTETNVSLEPSGEWAVVGENPILLSLDGSINEFTLSFDAIVPENYGTILGWDACYGSTTPLNIRFVHTNAVNATFVWQQTDGALNKSGSATKLVPAGEHNFVLEWKHSYGTALYMDGSQIYSSTGLKFTGYVTTTLSIGGSVNSQDILSGLKVRNVMLMKARASATTATVNGKGIEALSDRMRLAKMFNLGAESAAVVFEIGDIDLSDGLSITPDISPALVNGTLSVWGREDFAKPWNRLETWGSSAAVGATIDLSGEEYSQYRFFKLKAE